MKSFFVFFLILTQCFFVDFLRAQETPIPAAIFDPVQILLAEALTAKHGGDLLGARENLEAIVAEYPDSPHIDEAKKEWGKVVWSIIHSNTASPEVVIHKVGANDTLGKIAKTYGTTIELIKIRNKLSGDLIKFGQRLSIWNSPFTININKATNHLSLDLNGKTVKIYPVSTGKSETTTPVGEFIIQSRYPNPTWFHQGEIVPPGAPENFLGTRWLGFDKPKYGIHGTIYPELIGQSVSGGCVRMKNEDVEELYDIIPTNTNVSIKDSR